MKSKRSFTKAEADGIVLLIKQKLKADTIKQKSIRSEIRQLGFHASDYSFRNGYTAEQFLSVAKISGKATLVLTTVAIEKPVKIQKTVINNSSRGKSDESYVIDLCDEVLNQKALRQHCFDFLRGDTGIKLPVDAWYPNLKLVVEFREKQHTEEVTFWDKRQTASGMSRAEQRKRYDQKRREVLPKHGIKLIEIGYDDFEYTRGKKLIRHKTEDLEIIKGKLNK